MNNPILRNIKYFYLYLFFWVILTVIYFNLLKFNQQIDFQIALFDSIIFNFLLAGLGLSFWYPVKYISVERTNIIKLLFNHVIGGFLSTLVWLFAGYFIIKIILSNTIIYDDFFFATLSWRFLIGILFYFFITAFYYVIIYYKESQERTERESELKNLITEAELKSLKFQINPHFIFNSLNSMSALTTIDPDKAKKMILKLADFLRYTLATNDNQKNKLKDELKNIKLYLEIEKIRFEDKFEFVEEINEECLNLLVPNMILQPLVENAIKHAVYESINKVTLKLACKCENNFMKISLENNFEDETGSLNGTGIGLKNIRKRLEIIYNQNDLMEIQKQENIFKIIMKIPQ